MNRNILSKKGDLIFISDLKRGNAFLRGTIDNLRKEVVKLREENKLYRLIVKGKVKVVFDRVDPKKFERMNRIIDGEALKVCGESGSWFYWKDLYDRLCRRYPGVPWNPSTVDRRLQNACNEGLLTRVKPGTYIYNIHR